MITVRQIEKLWLAREFAKLARECLAGRAEATEPLMPLLVKPPAAAAIALIRLDEISQPNAPIVPALLRQVAGAQDGDGGWGDPVTTALCLRALLAHDYAPDRTLVGLTRLAALQRDDGLWPREPFRRMPGDALVTAFVLLQLGGLDAFRLASRTDAALAALATQSRGLDPATRRLATLAKLRAGARTLAALRTPA